MRNVLCALALMLSALSPVSSASVAFGPAHDGPRRMHSLVMAPEFAAPAEYDASFGSHNWKFAAKYVDLAVTQTQLDPEIRRGGIATAVYLDVHLCSSRTGPWPNRWPSPDCADLPPAAFYTQDGHPERPLTVSYNNRILQKLGDPASPQLQARAQTMIEERLREGRFDLVQFDDAVTPDEWYAAICYGVGRMEPWGYDCAAAPGGKARAPWTSRYTAERWKAGVAALAACSPLPALFNGLQGYAGDGRPAAIAEVVAHSPNAWGAMCDTCFYGLGAVPKNAAQWTGGLLESRLNGVLAVVGARKNVVVVDQDVTDPDARARALADIMLFYDPDLVWRWDAPCGERSHIGACPEAALTFYEPLGPYPRSTADLRDRSGNYVREFGACFEWGKPLGPCAAIVNPDRNASHPQPVLHQRYAHSLRINGDALCACYGDSGSIATNGPPMPAEISGGTGFVVFR